ncbi:MAG: cell division protein FtsZ, partial [Micrococcales bacterium]|nr:cell division protein FtsZ [Micrococcales bacterium]
APAPAPAVVPPSPAPEANGGYTAAPVPRPEPADDDAPVHTERESTPAEPVRQQPPRTVTFDENDDLDVPDFLK